MTVAPVDRSASVGFVGLGNLGHPMVRALLADGWSVVVFDTDRARVGACVDAGATAADTVGSLAACPVVGIAVPDDTAVGDVLAELLPEMAPGSTVLVHSTVLPKTAVTWHESGAVRGVDVLDAPVSGGAERAEVGDLTVMVGGDAAAFERVRPVLDAVGTHVLHLGPAGAGAAVKLANQVMLFAALAGAHEAMQLAGAFGVSESAVLAAVGSSLGDSWVTQNWGFFDEMVHAYDEGGTPVSARPWRKDLWDAVATARQQDLRLPVTELLSQVLADTVETHARER
ncbi:MAG: NAD-binding protein [Propionibacteriales bacterium]|nr:NAD-binding protein [Propionibacteriales bacterium]